MLPFRRSKSQTLGSCCGLSENAGRRNAASRHGIAATQRKSFLSKMEVTVLPG
jgi:hypothetical protein